MDDLPMQRRAHAADDARAASRLLGQVDEQGDVQSVEIVSPDLWPGDMQRDL
jgi:hypothetical protein